MKVISNFFYKNREIILLSVVFFISFFLRAYSMDAKYPFGWDQVGNAWAAKNILINHEFPLIGMVAKGNAGFYIGPIYYYFIAIFYWLTNLNPVASHYVALIANIFTFFTIYFVVKRLFFFRLALLACFINTVAFGGFYFDVVQWPVAFLPGISLLIFYFLYKLLKGEEKYIIFLAVTVGLAFHLHFTAVFFPIIILLCLPFFPWSKKTLLYLIASIPIFLIWFIPNLISQMQNSSQLSNMTNYLNTYYHGFHLTRFLQLAGDGLIQFDPFLSFAFIKPFKVFILPIFLLIFFREKISKDRIILSYLLLIFFLVPWLVFSTYRGEISDYYFSINRFIALLVVTYLISKVLFAKKILLNIIAIMFLIYYSYLNLGLIVRYEDGGGLRNRFGGVEPYVQSGRRVEFQEGAPESYIYYYLMREKGIIVY
jgi:4-amino-4-deoxy-L-arabinose transferase-like glycosyltransferase